MSAAATTSVSTSPRVYKGHWGYYAVSKEVFEQVKAAHKFYWRAVKQRADLNRWLRKAERNRVIRKKLRNSSGQVTGYELVGPRPAPAYDPRFVTLETTASLVFVNSGKQAVSMHDDIVGLYNKLRMPAATPAGVVPLTAADNSLLLTIVTSLFCDSAYVHI